MDRKKSLIEIYFESRKSVKDLGEWLLMSVLLNSESRKIAQSVANESKESKSKMDREGLIWPDRYCWLHHVEKKSG